MGNLPTYALFTQGIMHPSIYKGGWSAKPIGAWLHRQLELQPKEVDSLMALRRLVRKNKNGIALVGFLSEAQRKRRLLEVAARAAQAPIAVGLAGESLAQARAYSQALCDADLLVVPLVASAGSSAVALPPPELVGGSDGERIGHLALAEGLGTWQQVLSEGMETALSQDANAAARGFTLILKKNGRVGTRRLGMPDWGMLVGDVAKRAAAGINRALWPNSVGTRTTVTSRTNMSQKLSETVPVVVRFSQSGVITKQRPLVVTVTSRETASLPPALRVQTEAAAIVQGTQQAIISP